MDALIQAIEDLTKIMKGTTGGCSGTEAKIIKLLEKLHSTASEMPHLAMLAPEMDPLHHLWNHSIDWCSSLSRQLEKIIMLYQGAVQTATNAPPQN
jgi:hypothetical protein